MKSYVSQESFNGGEWSPHVSARSFETRATSCRYLENMLPLIQGPAVFRSGFRFRSAAKYADKKTRLIPFNFAAGRAYILEFGHQYIRFFFDGAPVTEATKNITAITKANPAVVTIVGHGYTTGDDLFIDSVGGMTTLNGKTYRITVIDPDTFSLDGVNSTAYDTYTSGGTVARILTLATTYTEDMIWDIKHTQDANFLYLCHPQVRPKELRRLTPTSWTLSDFEFIDGPYLDVNVTTTTIAASATTGSAITLTASTAIFASTDVGRWVRTGAGGTWGWARITAFTSGTSVTATVVGTLGGTAATAVWRLGAWSTTTGWPEIPVFFQDRLFFMELAFDPQRIDASSTANFNNFSLTQPDGTIGGDSAFTRFLRSSNINKILWGIPLEKSLILGTSGGEWVVQAATFGEAITPVSAAATEFTNFGSKSAVGFYDGQPYAQKVNNTILFVDSTGRSTGQIAYRFESNGFDTESMNRFADHIMSGNIVDTAYQSEPENRYWQVEADGRLNNMAYNVRDQVNGWGRVTSKGRFKSIAVIPSIDNTFNQLWAVVERDINGSTVQYIESMDDIFNFDDDIYDGFFVDSGLTYDGRTSPAADLTFSATTGTGVTVTAGSGVFGSSQALDYIQLGENVARISVVVSPTEVTVDILSDFEFPLSVDSSEWVLVRRVSRVSGLDHLIGETVTIAADGATHPTAVVAADGSIDLVDLKGVVHVGLGYRGICTGHLYEGKSNFDTTQGRIKRLNETVFDLYNSLGGKYGVIDPVTGEERLNEIEYRTPTDRMDKTVGLKTGFFRESWPDGFTDIPAVTVIQDNPLPFTLRAIIAEFETQE